MRKYRKVKESIDINHRSLGANPNAKSKPKMAAIR
tara:strand:+ start:1597 stop:1701 length:105 start_codon:yes stop_codon:yes gene_type:complete